MNQQRLGVSCKFCGQPVVLHDAQPGELPTQLRVRGAVVLRCMSCRQRGSYGTNAFHAFEAVDTASGDWEAVPHRFRVGA